MPKSKHRNNSKKRNKRKSNPTGATSATPATPVNSPAPNANLASQKEILSGVIASKGEKLPAFLMEKAMELGRFGLSYVDPSKHDAVDLGEVEAKTLIELGSNKELIYNYSAKIVALDDFVVSCCITGNGWANDVKIYYRRYQPDAIALDENGHPCKRGTEPTIRGLYEAFYLNADTNTILASLQTIAWHDEDRKPHVGASVGAMLDNLINAQKSSKDELSSPAGVISAQVISLYALVQNQIAECPEVFVTAETEKLKKSRSDTKSIYAARVKRSKTAVVRRKYGYKDSAGPKKIADHVSYKITCEFYTVRGHWRKCKSGKVIWINSYPKGTDRNNPNRQLKTKEYVVTE